MVKSITQRQTWVIVPAYNEEKYLERFLAKLSSFTKNIIVINDGSTDSTENIAKKFSSQVINHPVNLGKGSALKTGSEYAFEYLNADAVIYMDGDDQHDPHDLANLEQALQTNDVVFGVRTLEGEMPFIRQIGNRCISLLVYVLYGAYVPDILGGFNGITKDAYKKINWYAREYDIELELVVKTLLAHCSYQLVPVKTIYHDLDRGMTLLDAVRIVLELLSWRISR